MSPSPVFTLMFFENSISTLTFCPIAFLLKAYLDSNAYGWLTAGALVLGKNTLVITFLGFKIEILSPECT